MMYQIDDHPIWIAGGCSRHLASFEVRLNLPCQRSIASDGDPLDRRVRTARGVALFG